MTDHAKKLYRSKRNKIIAGVCAGIAEYFNIDPTIVRLIYILLTIFTAVAPFVIIYLIMWIIVPVGEGEGQIRHQ
jgi:phage shock protein C